MSSACEIPPSSACSHLRSYEAKSCQQLSAFLKRLSGVQNIQRPSYLVSRGCSASQMIHYSSLNLRQQVPLSHLRLSDDFKRSSSIIPRIQNSTYTLLAHLVTFLPSFKQSISPLPLLSLLHCMKSSLYDLHLAPMKKLADNKGAELLPISVTGGISAGRGVVSMRVVWLNLN